MSLPSSGTTSQHRPLLLCFSIHRTCSTAPSTEHAAFISDPHVSAARHAKMPCFLNVSVEITSFQMVFNESMIIRLELGENETTWIVCDEKCQCPSDRCSARKLGLRVNGTPILPGLDHAVTLLSQSNLQTWILEFLPSVKRALLLYVVETIDNLK